GAGALPRRVTIALNSSINSHARRGDPRGRRRSRDQLMDTAKPFRSARFPQSREELHSWILEHLGLAPDSQSAVLAAIDSVFTRHQELWEASKEEALQALGAHFAYEIVRLQHQLAEKEMAVTSISQHFERLVAELTD